MSKFHINKHGVPAPCKATKGNCPLGGDSGSEGHFDSKEDAQAYADKKNQQEHGITPEVLASRESSDIQVSQEDFDAAFQDSYEGGDVNQVTGISLQEFEEDYNNNEEYERIYNQIPDSVKDSDDKANTVVIPEKNLRNEMDFNIMSTGEENRPAYEEMKETIRAESPEDIDNSVFYSDNGDIAEGALRDEIVNFATEKAKEDSQFSMNGEKMYVQPQSDRERNYAKEYFESDKYAEFKKNR